MRGRMSGALRGRTQTAEAILKDRATAAWRSFSFGGRFLAAGDNGRSRKHPVSNGLNELRDKDSNLDYRIQSPASYH